MSSLLHRQYQFLLKHVGTDHLSVRTSRHFQVRLIGPCPLLELLKVVHLRYRSHRTSSCLLLGDSPQLLDVDVPTCQEHWSDRSVIGVS